MRDKSRRGIRAGDGHWAMGNGAVQRPKNGKRWILTGMRGMESVFRFVIHQNPGLICIWLSRAPGERRCKAEKEIIRLEHLRLEYEDPGSKIQDQR